MRLGKPNNKGTAIKDDVCEYPAAYIRPTGCVSIVAIHNGQPHMLILWPDDLEELANICRKNRATLAAQDEAAA